MEDMDTKHMQSSMATIQHSLRQEILQLQKDLEDQIKERRSLEQALGHHHPVPCDANTQDDLIHKENSTRPQNSEDLIKEISTLELEVVYLEQHLLSLYRKQFSRQLTPSFTNHESLRSVSKFYTNPLGEFSDISEAQKILDSGIYRSQYSVSQHLNCSRRASPHRGFLAQAMDAHHSMPLSMLERKATANEISLREHLGAYVHNHDLDMPNLISEEMIKCISAIYCKIAEPPLINHEFPSSPVSFSLSPDGFSPSDYYEAWNKNSFHLDNPFDIEGSREFSGPYCTTVEVRWICRDSKKLGDIGKIQKFRLLVSQLETVDLRQMKYEEKLAFWINVHNALAMHAFLVFGIPKNSSKRFSIVLKAAYNVGGQSTSIETIQSCILGCRLPQPGLWFQKIFSSNMKHLRVHNEQKSYGIEHSDSRLHFALCLGSHSDPPLRLYTSKSVFQELEVAMEDYIQATIRVRKQHKILLPKLVESFARDSDLCPAGFLETIKLFTSEAVKKIIKQHGNGKSLKSIEWVPHNFDFRYLLSKELADLSLVNGKD